MSSIRKQTIISSIVVYIGFLVGAVNIYFFTKNGSFTPAQYGLTRIFTDFGQNMYVFASLGVIPIIYKFYPYYKDNLASNKIDLLTWAFLLSVIGFILATCIGIYFGPYFINKYSTDSKLIADYYYWLFPFAMGMLFFYVLEAFCWAIQETVITNFLKETLLRIITTVFILLFYFRAISFATFTHLFSFLYLIIIAVLLFYLSKKSKLHFSFTVSRVTKKFWKKIIGMQSYVFGGTLIVSIAATIDSFIIAGNKGLGLAAVGVFGLAQYTANLVQVPQRSILSVSVGVLSQAWKDKDYKEINRIYHRSSINLLLLSLLIFGNVYLNVERGMEVLNLQEKYKEGLTVVLILGIARIIDAGTGVNGNIILTSNRWRFDFVSGICLFILRIPLTWYLITHIGITGSAIAELCSYTVYNLIRFEFLRRTYNMQPFTKKTLYSLIIGVLAIAIIYYTAIDIKGWLGIFVRSISFSSVMIFSIIYLDLTPDATQLWHKYKTRLFNR